MFFSLRHLKLYADGVKWAGGISEIPIQCASYEITFTFTCNDLLLVSKTHNGPSFVTRYLREHKLNRILMDGGSVNNMMSKSMIHDLGITIEELSRSHIMTQGFNLE